MDNVARYPLDELLGTNAQLRVVRFLTSQATRPSSAPEIATATGLTGQGVRNALERLVGLGYVVRTGGGRTQLYAFRDDEALQGALRRLFDVERARHDGLVRDLRSAFSGIAGVRSAWVQSWPSAARAPLEVGVETDADSLADVRVSSRAAVARYWSGCRLDRGRLVWHPGLQGGSVLSGLRGQSQSNSNRTPRLECGPETILIGCCRRNRERRRRTCWSGGTFLIPTRMNDCMISCARAVHVQTVSIRALRSCRS